MRLIWTRPAQAERKKIYAYIEQHDTKAAEKMDALFEEKALRLLKYPRMGRIGRAAGTREWVAHPNYILVYTITPSAVRILRVRHAAQQWP